MAPDPTPLARAQGALVGLAVGDALGTTLEFKAPGTFPPITDIVGGGPFGLPAGAWTDDTSMALATGHSLLERGGFDPLHMLGEYRAWYREGRWSSTGRCFDIGGATRVALERSERDPGDAFPGAGPGAAGNGPLMKLAPIPIAYAHDAAVAVRFSGDSARMTHSRLAEPPTRYFAGLLVGALRGVRAAELVRDGAPYVPYPGAWDGPYALPDDIAAIATGSYLRREPPDIKGGGYIVHALEAALWAVARSDTFEEAILAAANLGDDADTTAAIAGQLAGAMHGVDAIPARWQDVLHRGGEIRDMATRLHELVPGAGVDVEG